jgi:hypothetical protein
MGVENMKRDFAADVVELHAVDDFVNADAGGPILRPIELLVFENLIAQRNEAIRLIDHRAEQEAAAALGAFAHGHSLQFRTGTLAGGIALRAVKPLFEKVVSFQRVIQEPIQRVAIDLPKIGYAEEGVGKCLNARADDDVFDGVADPLELRLVQDLVANPPTHQIVGFPDRGVAAAVRRLKGGSPAIMPTPTKRRAAAAGEPGLRREERIIRASFALELRKERFCFGDGRH